MFKFIRCTRARKLLPLHVAGDLSGRRAERSVAKHLARCGSCRRVAVEYDASRQMLRTAAATLPPDFDGAFYEGIRNSVLAQITRDHTKLAPRTPIGFATLFKPPRLVYAASLALLFILAALSLHISLRTSEDSQRREMIANANHPLPAPTLATPTPETIRGSMSGIKSPIPILRAGGDRSSRSKARDGAPRRSSLTKHATPSPVTHESPSPTIAAASSQANASEVAVVSNNSGVAAAQPEVSRIEIQTSDPNIRIIWLSPKADAEPLR